MTAVQNLGRFTTPVYPAATTIDSGNTHRELPAKMSATTAEKPTKAVEAHRPPAQNIARAPKYCEGPRTAHLACHRTVPATTRGLETRERLTAGRRS